MDVYKWLSPIQVYTYNSKKVLAIVISGYQSHTNNAALIYQHNQVVGEWRITRGNPFSAIFPRKSIFHHFLPFSTIFDHCLPGHLDGHDSKHAEINFRPLGEQSSPGEAWEAKPPGGTSFRLASLPPFSAIVYLLTSMSITRNARKPMTAFFCQC